VALTASITIYVYFRLRMRVRTTAVLVLSLLFLVVELSPSSLALPPLAFRKSAQALPACPPLSVPVEGTWTRYPDVAGESDRQQTFAFHPLKPCAYAVHDRETFFRSFAGKAFLITGDSIAREFFFDWIRFVGNCCAQQHGECKPEDVLDAPLCKAVDNLYESYPAHPLTFSLANSFAPITFTFCWLAYAEETMDTQGQLLNTTPAFSFLTGRQSFDFWLLHYGHWNLIFDGAFDKSRRIDSQHGVKVLTKNSIRLKDAVLREAKKHPEIFKDMVWLSLTPDEVDGYPHPRHRKRFIRPNFREEARKKLSEIWGPLASAEWDLSAMLDVRSGGVERPFNDGYLTYDGMHVFPQINIILSWQLWSHFARKGSPQPATA
jgi:hypothetical protein